VLQVDYVINDVTGDVLLPTLNRSCLGYGRLQPSEDGGAGDRLARFIHRRLMEMSLQRPRAARAVPRGPGRKTDLQRRVR